MPTYYVKEILMNHPFRFGIITLQNLSWPKLVEDWKEIEALGYDSIWVADHFITNPVKDGWYDGWTLLPALATLTSTVRIGTLVTNFIYRNPAVIAKQAMTVDHISQGRLELGIGATSKRDLSHRTTGIENWPTAERVQRFREVVEILDQMLRQEMTTYTGRYYQVTEAWMHPATIQMPRPPLTIAAHGPTTLKIAAQFADSWNSYGGFNTSPAETLAITRQRSEILDEYCVKIGRDPGEIRRSFLAGLSADTPLASLEAFYDFVGRLHEIGISEFIFYYDYADLQPDQGMDRAMLERIAMEAIPAMRLKEAG
jgi:alkanesulfonate monooxygenase SsuD/methylene tetrahydromethanopterin reductase-like flavin-dependent oxidoreductase (luciferase family)